MWRLETFCLYVCRPTVRLRGLKVADFWLCSCVNEGNRPRQFFVDIGIVCWCGRRENCDGPSVWWLDADGSSETFVSFYQTARRHSRLPLFIT